MSEEKVRVRFVTKHDEFVVTDAPFAVPTKLGRSGLSEVINHLLELATSQPFDFIIGNKLLRVSLKNFISKAKLSIENVITIEYMPAVTLSEEVQTSELPSWIGSLDSTLTGIIVAGCYDGSLQTINSSTLGHVECIACHEDPIRAVKVLNSPSFSPLPGNSKQSINSVVATASKDQTVRLWSLGSTCTQLAICKGHVNSVESLDYCSQSKVLFTGDWSGNIFGWNLTGLGLFDDDADPSQDGGEGTAEGRSKKKRRNQDSSSSLVAEAFDVQVRKPVFTLRAHAQSISGIQVINSGNRVFSCSWDHSIKEWDMERQDCVGTIAGSKVCTAAHYSEKSQLLASAHPDGKVRLWDPRQTDEAACVNAFGRAGNSGDSPAQFVSHVQWHPESAQIFAACDYEGKIRVWDTRAQVPLGTSEAHDGKALCLTWLRPGRSTADEEEEEGVEGEESVRGGVTAGDWRVLSGGSDCVLKATPLSNR